MINLATTGIDTWRRLGPSRVRAVASRRLLVVKGRQLRAAVDLHARFFDRGRDEDPGHPDSSLSLLPDPVGVDAEHVHPDLALVDEKNDKSGRSRDSSWDDPNEFSVDWMLEIA